MSGKYIDPVHVHQLDISAVYVWSKDVTVDFSVKNRSTLKLFQHSFSGLVNREFCISMKPSCLSDLELATGRNPVRYFLCKVLDSVWD